LQLLDVNTGPVAGVEALQPLVAAAVTATDAAAEQHAEAIRAETARRIDEWLQRTNRWKQAAQQLRQHRTLRRHAQLVDDEQALAKDMNPDRRLVRPLLVVVPADFDGEIQGAR